MGKCDVYPFLFVRTRSAGFLSSSPYPRRRRRLVGCDLWTAARRWTTGYVAGSAGGDAQICDGRLHPLPPVALRNRCAAAPRCPRVRLRMLSFGSERARRASDVTRGHCSDASTRWRARRSGDRLVDNPRDAEAPQSWHWSTEQVESEMMHAERAPSGPSARRQPRAAAVRSRLPRTKLSRNASVVFSSSAPAVSCFVNASRSSTPWRTSQHGRATTLDTSAFERTASIFDGPQDVSKNAAG